MSALAPPAPREAPAPGGCCPGGGAAALGDGRGGGLRRFARDAGGGLSRLELLTPDAHCGACLARIERGLAEEPGVASARVNLSLRRVAVTFDPVRIDADGVAGALSRLGYPARPFDAEAMRDLERDAEGRDLLARMGVAGFAATNVMLLSVGVWSGADGATRDLLHWISALIALPAAAFAGVPFFRSAVGALRAGRANMDVPISLAILLAAAVSLRQTALSGPHAYFDAAVTLCFFLLVGRWLEHRARRAARTAAAELGGLRARSAILIDPDGARRAVAVEDLRPGDRVAVAAGERLPADGRIVEGESELDRSMMTGESRPEPVAPGATAEAGSLNLSAPLILEATATGDDTVLAGLARMIEAAEAARGRYADMAARAARLYVPTVHAMAGLTFVGWLMVGAGLDTALLTAAAVLIITCPCALGLAAPAVHAAASGRLFRLGVFLKDGAALERLAEVDTVVLDKTGTLTEGRPALSDGPEDPAAWSAARALAEASRHPFAAALAEAAAARGRPAAVATDLREVPGRGVEGRVDGALARLGRSDWCGATEEDGGSAVWLRLGDAAPVRFGMEDPLKPDAAEAVAAFRARGLSVRLLSGDARDAVRRAAVAAGIETWEARADPAAKLARLEALAGQGRRVLMIGDGLNDAPSLAAAHASISPAEAADASRVAAGLVLGGPALMRAVDALDVARAARARSAENFRFAALYNIVAAPVAAAGLLTPLIAALAMSGSSIVVTLNALRLGVDRRRAGEARR